MYEPPPPGPPRPAPPPSSSFGSACGEAEARERAIRELADAFVETAVQLSLLQVRQLDIAQQLLAHQGGIAGSVANWLSQFAGLSCREAKQLCRVARRLPDLPQIDAAFRGGRLSLDTADVLLKVATTTNEAVLLQTAGAATGAQLRKIIATFRRIRRHDEPEPDRDEHTTYGSHDETMWALHARLQPGRGGEAEAALRAAQEDLYASTEPGPDGTRPAVSASDALVHLCRTYLEGTVTAKGQLPERFLTIVHVDLTGDAAPASSGPARSRDRHEGDAAGPDAVAPRRGRTFSATDRDDIAHLRGMGAIDGASLERFLCDSLVSVVDHHGVDVTASAPVRLATAAQRQALHAMHPTCQHPGCGRTRYLQAHHLVDYHPKTGPTALWNLALLCDEHHDHLHRPGWSAALSDDHTLLVWKPGGAPLHGGALRPPIAHATDDAAPHPHAPDDAKDAKDAKSAQGTHTVPAGIDVGGRLHGVGERMDAWALDTFLHHWLESTAA